MKKFTSLLMSLALVLSVCFSMPVGAFASTAKTTVNAAIEYQKMNGFGASACWWAKDVGGWDNLDDIIKLLYDKNEGIGLNIYRYNLGAGSDKNENEGTLRYRNDRWTESFWNDDKTYNFDKDANAQKALASAKKFAGDDLRVTLFCNSAPVQLTKNGFATADDYWWSNLDSSNYKAFAEYGYKCADYFLSKGYRVTDISPANEPYGHWYREYTGDGEDRVYSGWAGQEGCYYSAEELRDLYKEFIAKFRGSEVDAAGCKVSMLEANDMKYQNDPSNWLDLEKYIARLISADKGAANLGIRLYTKTLTMHSYWTSAEEKKQVAADLKAKYPGISVAQTEYCQMSDDIYTGVNDLIKANGMSSGLTIEYGVALANIICDDLTILNVNEWDWWTGVAFGGYTDGLVYVNKDDHSIETSKRLWTMGNYSRFTEEGSVRVGSSNTDENIKTVAFKNPDNTLSIVLINNADNAVDTGIELKGVSGDKNYSVYTTDASNDLANTSNGYVDSNAVITLPAKSVSTVVITDHTHSFGENNQACAICGAANPDYVAPTQPTTQATTTQTTAQPTTQTTTQAPTTTQPTTQAPVTTQPTTQAETTTTTSAEAETKTQKPKATSIKKLSKGKKSFNATWKKITGVNGYQIQYSTDKKFKKNTKTVTIKKNTASTTIKKLKANKKYYVRVRSYKNAKVNGKTVKVCSSWSKVKTVTTKK